MSIWPYCSHYELIYIFCWSKLWMILFTELESRKMHVWKSWKLFCRNMETENEANMEESRYWLLVITVELIGQFTTKVLLRTVFIFPFNLHDFGVTSLWLKNKSKLKYSRNYLLKWLSKDFCKPILRNVLNTMAKNLYFHLKS